MGLGKAFSRNTVDQVRTIGLPGSSLFNALASTGGSFGEIAGQSQLYLYATGMSIPGAWRAATLIADLIGRLPWDAYTSHGKDRAEQVSPTPPLLDQPFPGESRMDTFSAWALDLVWDGNAVGVIADRDAQGWPTAVYPVPSRFVGVRRVRENDHWLPKGTIEYSIGGLSYGAHEVVHIKGPHAPGALRGAGVLEAHCSTLDLATEQRRQASNLAITGVPTGKLKVTNPDATEPELQAVKDGWLKAQRDRTVAVLNATTDFEPLAWNPRDSQMIEARQFSLTELALIFGLPPRYLAAPTGGSMDYTSSEIEALELLKFGSIAGHLARFEQTLSLAFPPGTIVKANLDALLRSDTLSRYQAHEIGIRAGFLRRSEVRTIEDLPPVPGIDDAPAAEAAPPVEAVRRSNLLDSEQGRRLWHYWTHGEGLARWRLNPHPWTALHAALLKEGVPEDQAGGLATNIFVAVFGETPAEHAAHGKTNGHSGKGRIERLIGAKS